MSEETLLARVLDLSRAILAAAEEGDGSAAASLDAERLRLLESVSRRAATLDAAERGTVREIAELNDRSIGLLEHHWRIKGRELDLAAVGRRAVSAYATNGRRR